MHISLALDMNTAPSFWDVLSHGWTFRDREGRQCRRVVQTAACLGAGCKLQYQV